MIDHLTSDAAAAAERLAFELLIDAYFDVAAVLRGAQPRAAEAIFAAIERRTVDVLQRTHRQSSEGPDSRNIAIAVGELIWEVMGQAHDTQAQRAVA